MRYSKLEEVYQSRKLTEVFNGYNHNARISDGEFYDMQNLTSSHYPVLAPRERRRGYTYTQGVANHKTNGIICKDALCYVDGTSLYVNNYRIDGLTLTDTPKQLVSMGAYLIIFPDKKYLNTQDFSDHGSIEASYTSPGGVSFEMCMIDGEVYDGIVSSEAEPGEPSNNAYWIDTSSKPNTLKQYSASTSMWTPIATTYVRISAQGIASSFKQYDAVRISGIDPSIDALKDLNDNTSVLWEVHEDEENGGAGDYVVVIGFLDSMWFQTEPVKLERKLPKMDFVIESNNRLWGCRYGTNNSGEVVNEIYASKLGDFKNWECYMGLATDSYAATCGTDGQFTGAITHLGYPLFFKENFMHKVYGQFPANFQIQSTACRGVMKGAGNSLAIVNEALFYKSRNGVCVYDGSLPSEVANEFGDISYSAVEGDDPLRNGAVAGNNNNKYYISMMSETDNKWYLFVFDAHMGMWHKEDELHVDAFCSCDGVLYYIDHKDKLIKSIGGKEAAIEDKVRWMAETGVLGTDMPDRKYIARLMVRMSLDIGSRVMFYIQYDSSGDYEHVQTMVGTTLRSFTFPIRPKRCDHFRLRIVGEGQAKIFSITQTIEQGSDL